MERGVKSTSKKHETSIHHHGLMKLLVVHALRKQGSSWKQILQQNVSQEGVSKSIEEQETEACSEGSSRNKMERKGKAKGRSEGVKKLMLHLVHPNLFIDWTRISLL